MPETEESLRDLVNSSGFPLQIRIEQEIRDYKAHYGPNWRIFAQEHRWVDQFTGSENFIDLILESHSLRAIIECKRVPDDVVWIFLIPDERNYITQARLYWTHLTEQRRTSQAWGEFQITPDSPESAFCVVRGQNEKDKPMLERLAGIVLRATLSIAQEELDLVGKPSDLGSTRFYIPLIVTTATLKVCRFDPKRIDLKTGLLIDSNFEEVPYIRFQKNLSPGSSQRVASDLSEVNKRNMRTIFVVNSERLTEFLREVNIRVFDQQISILAHL